MTENQRALEMMGATGSEQRRAKRRSVHVGATLSVGDTNSIAWIKDISDSGICLYTKHHPMIGQPVQIHLYNQKLPTGLATSYEGTVIRVQTSGAGAAYGVAVHLTGANSFRKTA